MTTENETQAADQNEPLTRERAALFLLMDDGTPEGAAAARAEGTPEQKEEFVEYIPMILEIIKLFRGFIQRRRGG